ncbi:hypothetical protein ABKN59_004196 [Abortiporus biennis]
MSRPFLLHTVAFASMAYGWFGLGALQVSEWIETQKGGHLQFLTIQGLAFAAITMTLSIVKDLIPGLPLVNKLKRITFLIALPLAVVISTIYWTLLLLFPHHILREEGPTSEPSSSSAASQLARIPISIDLALHAVPALSLLIDFFLFEKKYKKSTAIYGALTMAAAYAVGYGLWVEECAKANGIFPYPFLTVNPLNVRIGIYAGAAMLAFVSFQTMNNLHS